MVLLSTPLPFYCRYFSIVFRDFPCEKCGVFVCLYVCLCVQEASTQQKAGMAFVEAHSLTAAPCSKGF